MVVQLEWSDQSFGKLYGTLRFFLARELFLTINISSKFLLGLFSWSCSSIPFNASNSVKILIWRPKVV